MQSWPAATPRAGAERLLVDDVLGTLVDDRACVVIERATIGIALDEVLMDLRADSLQEPPQMRHQRIIPQEIMTGLQ